MSDQQQDEQQGPVFGVPSDSDEILSAPTWIQLPSRLMHVFASQAMAADFIAWRTRRNAASAELAALRAPDDNREIARLRQTNSELMADNAYLKREISQDRIMDLWRQIGTLKVELAAQSQQNKQPEPVSGDWMETCRHCGKQIAIWPPSGEWATDKNGYDDLCDATGGVQYHGPWPKAFISLRQQSERLRRALEALAKNCTRGMESGDWGNFTIEDWPELQQARAALDPSPEKEKGNMNAPTTPFEEFAMNHTAHTHCSACGGCLLHPLAQNLVPVWCVECVKRIDARMPAGVPRPWDGTAGAILHPGLLTPKEESVAQAEVTSEPKQPHQWPPTIDQLENRIGDAADDDDEPQAPEQLDRKYRDLAEQAIEASKDFFETDDLTHVLIDDLHIPVRDAVGQLLMCREQLTAVRQQNERMTLALKTIRDEGYRDCQCDDHSGPDCCNAVEHFCPTCIAGSALAAPPAPQAQDSTSEESQR